LLAGLISMTTGVSVLAVSGDTEIGVSLCGSSVPAAQLTVTEPASDSVVPNAVTSFRGTVANTTQVEIMIDGQFNNSVSIGANETTFQADVTLAQGTHTVTVTAIAICGGQNASQDIILTHQPAVEPSSGVTTPTEIPADTPDEGVVISSEPLEEGDVAAPGIEQLPVIGPIVNAVTDFSQSIGLSQTLAGSGAPLSVGVARVALTAAAVTSVVMAASLAPLALQAAPGITEVFHAGSHRSMIYLEWAIRGVGVLAMAIAYFI
jgi:hypothetical protein